MSQHISIDHAHDLDQLVQLAISKSILLSGQNVQYQIDQEQVYLSGVVNSYYEKQLAQESISRIQGVRQIHNRLCVEPPQNRLDLFEIH